MKAKKLLLHIGHRKTGTTALQQTLWDNRKALLANGILFPDVGESSGNAIRLGYYLFNEQTDDALRRQRLGSSVAEARSKGQQIWQDIKEAVARTQYEKLLISSEHFFGVRTAAELARINIEVQTVAEEREVIAYLRAPDTAWLSGTQETLKTFRPLVPPSRMHAKDVIAPLMEHWQGQVSLNIFDRNTLKDGDIVTDFVTKYCQGVDPADLHRRQSETNVSLSAEAMAILLDLRAGRLDRTTDHPALIREIRRADLKIHEPTRPKLFATVARNFINWRAPDLYWLRDKHGLTFPNIDYAEINMEDIDEKILNFDAVEQICKVDPDRKAMVYRRAMKRMAMPPLLRRWLAKH